MGAWGTAIFSDDFACDLRDEYKDLVSLKFDDDEILKELSRDFLSNEGIESSTFWIALALCQHKLGRLSDEVKNKAIELIDSGEALEHWKELVDEGDKNIKGREKALLKAKEQILSEQPKRKELKPSKWLKERIDQTYALYPWKEGNLYAYKTDAGNYAILACVKVEKAHIRQNYRKVKGVYEKVDLPEMYGAAFLLIDYKQPTIPGRERLENLKPYIKPHTKEEEEKYFRSFIVPTRARYEAELARPLEEWTKDIRKYHVNKTEKEFKDFCDKLRANYIENFKKYSNEKASIERGFQVGCIIEARANLKIEKVSDLNFGKKFQYESNFEIRSPEQLEEYVEKKLTS